MISTSRNIARRYKCEDDHNNNVEDISLKIFDALKKQNHLTKRDRLILQISAILNSCGQFINLNDVGENSYKIIMSTEIIGISQRERTMVANIVRYPNENFPSYAGISDSFSSEDYIKAAKLNAILRLAISMVKSHRQKFRNITAELRDDKLTITGRTLYDITLEQGIFRKCSDFFEEVYGIIPVLKQKKQF